jgi:hypothetical protein
MTYFPTSGDKFHGLIHGKDDRSRPIAGYRFGWTLRKRVRARTALIRVSGYFKTIIEAIADSKLRRMERELELRGVSPDRSGHYW